MNVPISAVQNARMSGVRRRDRSVGKQFWRRFEEQVEVAVSELGNAKVQRDVNVPGLLSQRSRQIDVLATGKIAGRTTRVLFEAKCYTGRVQIGTIDELVGKALDVAVQHAVLFAPNGFSEGALARAEGTLASPLQIGTAVLEVDWPGAERDTGAPVMSAEEPSIFRREPPLAWVRPHLRELDPEPDGKSEYWSFFRGRAPLDLYP
ncbi:restriction endonuclease [Streptomyces sp. cg28]|uniref:restriction endonuclease n=1 Tax=Streptomyces sp. cg28 TaxID=3403457 RepID=UPI003B214697